MYRLENNVAWTEELKEAFKHGTTRGKIVCEGNTYDEENHLVSFEIEDDRYVPDLGIIGQAVARQITIELVDLDKNINLENKTLEAYIGADYEGQTYYINYGKFIVTDPPENDDTNGKVKIVAYDYMLKFNQNINENLLHFPCSLKQLLNNICTQAGVELGTEHFANEDFEVENNQYVGKQLRDMLKGICQCAFSWARIGQDNKLYLDFNATGSTTEIITTDDYKQDAFKKANEYYGPVNVVTYADSDIQGQEESVPDSQSIVEHGETELIIYDNLFAYTETKRKALINAGSRLFGLRYMPIQEFKLTGLVYLDSSDIIEVENEENETFSTRVFNHTIRYQGYVEDEIINDSTTEIQRQYKNNNSAAIQNSRTEIIVDKANQKITSVVEEIGDREGRTTTLTQDIDGLEAKIEKSVNFEDTVEGRGELETQEAWAFLVLGLEIRGDAKFESFYHCNDYYCGDSYTNG